jgi:hypothetical protein
MVRMASREVISVFLRELFEGPWRLATDPAYDIRDQLSCVLAVGRGYERQFLGAPPGQAALGDEFIAKAGWFGSSRDMRNTRAAPESAPGKVSGRSKSPTTASTPGAARPSKRSSRGTGSRRRTANRIRVPE